MSPNLPNRLSYERISSHWHMTLLNAHAKRPRALSITFPRCHISSPAFCHLHLNDACDSSMEERLKSGIAFRMDFRGNRVSTFDTIEKKRIWRTLDNRLYAFHLFALSPVVP